MPELKTIIIQEEPIRLGQFLKLAEVAQDGLEAKNLIQSGQIKVNGVIETRRGKKLTQGEQVLAGETIFVVQCQSPTEKL